MLTLNILAMALAMMPSLVSAELFSSKSGVDMLDEKGFEEAMKSGQTSVVAFVAPWCGHCQQMAPEYIKAAKSLHPLVPAYAIDCGANANNRLCSEQDVIGFPTLKVFPEGNKVPPMVYSGDRSATAIVNWVSLQVPNHIDEVYDMEGIKAWVEKNKDKPRALLLMKGKGIHLQWKALGNKYYGELHLAVTVITKNTNDISSQLGLTKGAKMVVYHTRSDTPTIYRDSTKVAVLSKYFDTLVGSTAH